MAIKTVKDAIFYIEDIVDKHSTEYYEPQELLNRIKRETIVVLEAAVDDFQTKINWEIINTFIAKKKLTANPSRLTDDVMLVEGYTFEKNDDIDVPGTKTTCQRIVSLNKSRNPFDINAFNYYIDILEEPSFGENEDDFVVYKNLSSSDPGYDTDEIGTNANRVCASQSLINRVLSAVVVSIVGSQFNQTMQYEWAKLNKQEAVQNDNGNSKTTNMPQQE